MLSALLSGYARSTACGCLAQRGMLAQAWQLTSDAGEDADDAEGDGGVREQVEVALQLLLVACRT